MANVIKYKGQLFKRVDSDVKAIKYKGQLFRRVDSSIPQKLEQFENKLKEIHLKHGKLEFRMRNDKEPMLEVKFVTDGLMWHTPLLQKDEIYKQEELKQHFFEEKDGKIVTAWGPHLTDADYLNRMHHIAKLVNGPELEKALEKTAQKFETKRQKEEELRKHEPKFKALVQKELNSRLHSVKNFAKCGTPYIDMQEKTIEVMIDMKHPRDIDRDEMYEMQDEFEKHIINALRGFAKVRFEINNYSMGDDGTETTHPVPFEGRFENAWYNKAIAEIMG